MRIKEVLWEADLTGVTRVLHSFAAIGSATLDLVMGGDTLTFAASRSLPVTIGRGEGSTVVIQDAAASRSHASVWARHGRFYLTDHSTNGTWVRPDGEDEIFVHRDEVLLRGAGEIRLGRSAAEGDGPAPRYEVRGG